jgi:lipopolysaccharide export system ATP-binding protein
MSKEEQQTRLKYLLEELDLMPLANNVAYTLSGGEKRRLEITRALVTSQNCCFLMNHSQELTLLPFMKSRKLSEG